MPAFSRRRPVSPRAARSARRSEPVTLSPAMAWSWASALMPVPATPTKWIVFNFWIISTARPVSEIARKQSGQVVGDHVAAVESPGLAHRRPDAAALHGRAVGGHHDSRAVFAVAAVDEDRARGRHEDLQRVVEPLEGRLAPAAHRDVDDPDLGIGRGGLALMGSHAVSFQIEDRLDPERAQPSVG